MTAADAALVTVPLGVLKKECIHFSPPLPRYKRDAIKRLGFGALNKVCLSGAVMSRRHYLRVHPQCPLIATFSHLEISLFVLFTSSLSLLMS